MSELQGEKLVTYLKDAITLEKDIMIQNETHLKYNQVMNQRKPQLKKTPLLIMPEVPKTNSTFNFFAYTMIFAGLIGVPSLLMAPFLPSIAGTNIKIGIFCLAICGISILFLKKINQDMENCAYLEKEKVKEKNEAIEKENQRKQERYNEMMQEWRKSMQDTCEVMCQERGESADLLERLYNMDVIYPKYRNLPALTSICEYFMTGRCDSLTGPHGAYNLYEDEVRKNTVIAQLNTVIKNLEQIKNNQYMLYQEVKEIQKNTAQILSEVEQVRGYTIAMTELTALNTYYTAMNERNNRIMMYYQI